MKKTTLHFVKRIVAWALAFVMIAALFPVTYAYAAGTTAERDYQSIMNLYAGPPSGYDGNNDDNPYGRAVGQNFALYEFQELLHFYSTNLNSQNSSALATDWADIATNQSGSYTKANMPHASYTQAIAFDPYGTGQKDCVAYVGWEAHDAASSPHQYILWVLNTKTGEYSNTFLLSPDGHGMPNDTAWLEETDIPPYMMLSFLSITAGDYNGDGKESLVAYVIADDRVGKSRQPYLIQVECTKDSGGKPILDNTNANRTISYEFLNRNYLSVKDLYENGAPQNKLGADLVSADFNGDGIDDLACLSYFNNLGGNPFNNYVTGDFGKAQLSVGFGGSGKRINNMNVQSRYISGVNTGEYKNEYTTVSFTAASIAAGDINNDGAQELVVAGYPLLIKKNDIAMNKGNTVLASYTMQNNSIVQTSFAEYERTDFSLRASSANDAVMSQMQVNCVAFNGFDTAEQVLVNNIVYNFNGNGFTEYNGNRFSSPSTSNETRFYISSVAVGVFDGNTDGKEEAIFTIGNKRTSGSSGQMDDYIFYRAYYRNSEWYKTNNDWNSRYGYRGDNLEEVLNDIVVAIDRDNDIIRAKFIEKEYVWSDPKVVAVLQAAPYFGELGGYGDFDSGDTTFSYTQIYSESSSMEHSESVSRGIAVEGGLAAGLKVSLEMGKTRGWSQSFENSVETSHSSTFSATAQNSVVLSRTPVVIYQYDLNYDGCHEGDSFAISVPLAPLNTQISIDVYNNFVKIYNENEQNTLKLNLLDQAYLNGNEGNPWQYQSSWSNNGVCFSKSGNVLGTDGGAAGVEYAEATGVTNGTTVSEGFHFGLSVQTGFSSAVGEFWGGATEEYDEETAIGHYKTSAVEKGCSGSVANIDSDGLYGDYGIPVSTSKAYSFIWTFGKWNWKADRPQSGSPTVVPILGYVLTNIYAPIPPVTFTSVDYDKAEKTFSFAWEPSERESNAVCAGYRLYQVNDDGYRLLTNDLISPNLTEYTLAVNSDDYIMRFVMTSVDENGMESVRSNEVIYIRGFEGKSAYDIAVKNGFKGTEEEWLASLVGKNGKDGVGIEKTELTATNGNIVTYTVYYTNGSTASFAVTNGINGTNGREIVLRTDAESGYLQWQYIGDSSWTNLISLADLQGLQGEKGEQGLPGEKGEQGIPGEKGEQGLPGETGEAGRSIASIEKASTDGLTDTYTITYTDGTSDTFNITNGEKGEQGITGEKGEQGEVGEQGEQGIVGEKGEQGEAGEKGEQGVPGETGEAGRGIASIEKTSTDGLTDTYTITYTDGTSDTFNITNGEKGEQGIQGDKGEQGIPGEKGEQGVPGEKGEQGVPGEKGDSGNNGQDGKDGQNGSAGVGISDISVDKNGVFTFTMTDGSLLNSGPYDRTASAKTVTILGSVSAVSLFSSAVLAVVLFIKRK